MKVSGFTFIKNGLSLGYPVLESIRSVDPLCDEIVINVGFDDPGCQQDDGTYAYLKHHLHGPRYHFLKHFWDPQMQKGGLILSEQTNLALAQCQGDICQYIQGDEVLHEKDLPAIRAAFQELQQREELDGLVFHYLHFYGNVDVFLHTRKVYRREVRTIKNGREIQSHLDAQGFRFTSGEKITAKQIDATVYHYGWAREEKVMQKKVKAFDRLYHGDKRDAQKDFEFRRSWGLAPFKGIHPAVMAGWIEQNRNAFSLKNSPRSFQLNDLRLALSDIFEKLSGWRLGEYKNFKELS